LKRQAASSSSLCGASPGSIGGFVSYGCIRMHNADVLDLYNRVSWGTTVVVTR
jgi:lipoprotein-anchoring transpeptidase ErfK/SrfK